MTNPDDAMAEVRVSVIREIVIGFGFIYGHKHVKKMVDKVADQILSTPFTVGGGKCKGCNGDGKWPIWSGKSIYPCPSCHGTGFHHDDKADIRCGICGAKAEKYHKTSSFCREIK